MGDIVSYLLPSPAKKGLTRSQRRDILDHVIISHRKEAHRMKGIEFAIMDHMGQLGYLCAYSVG